MTMMMSMVDNLGSIFNTMDSWLFARLIIHGSYVYYPSYFKTIACDNAIE